MAPDERRFDDEQLALVLRRAVELERRRDRTPAPLRPPPSGSGFSSDEVRAIAAEAGIDAGAVERALREAAEGPASAASRAVGGPLRLRREATVYGRLTEAVQPQLIGRIRREAAHHGVVVPEPGSLVWRSVGQPTQLDVVVEPEGSSTRVTVAADRSGAAALTVFGSFAAWLVAAGITGAALDPTGVAGAAAILGTAVVGGAATARTLWALGTRRVREKMARLLGAVDGGLEGAAGEPGVEPD